MNTNRDECQGERRPSMTLQECVQQLREYADAPVNAECRKALYFCADFLAQCNIKPEMPAEQEHQSPDIQEEVQRLQEVLAWIDDLPVPTRGATAAGSKIAQVISKLTSGVE